MQVEERETVEWVNLWWESANDKNAKRWMLIGDSVARQFRSELQNIAGDNVIVDFIGMSFHIEDKLFERNLKNALENEDYNYEKIIVTWGGHHGLYRETYSSKEMYLQYYMQYERLLKYVMTKCEQVIILAATHEVKSGNLNFLHEKNNKEIEMRNSISCKLAQVYKLLYIDLYTYMLERHNVYKHTDHVHFERDANGAIASFIYNIINKSDVVTEVCTYKKNLESLEDLEKLLVQSKRIILYGAGIIGKALKRYIHSRGKVVECFVISDNQIIDEPDEDIYHISELPYSLDECDIIISSKNSEIISMLNRMKYPYWKPTEKLMDFIQDYAEFFIE